MCNLTIQEAKARKTKELKVLSRRDRTGGEKGKIHKSTLQKLVKGK